MKTTGNTMLITGGGSGIGRGLAEAFHKLGNKVIIAGRRSHVLRTTADANKGMEWIELDTSDASSIDQTVPVVLERFPELNVLINNAGVQRVLDFAADDVDLQEANREIDTNVRGVVHMTTAFLRHLKSVPESVIVNVTSGLAFVPMARFPVYCATKAFVHSFTMSLRLQLKGSHVRVIELAPPWVKTDLDASHPERKVHEGMSPMPLEDFIKAAMQDLASDEEELKVAGAKFLYDGGISEKLYPTFEQINR